MKFTREVVLLLKAESGSNKAELMRRGQVIQCFEFYKEWTEEEVFQHLRDVLSLVLKVLLQRIFRPHFFLLNLKYSLSEYGFCKQNQNCSFQTDFIAFQSCDFCHFPCELFDRHLNAA